MNKKNLFFIKHIPIMILMIIMLFMLFLGNDRYYIMLSLFYVVSYCWALLLPHRTSIILIFLMGVLIDNFYDISLGTFSTILIGNMILSSWQSKHIKNHDFIKSFIFFIINSAILLLFIQLVNFIIPINFPPMISFLIISFIFFPVIFGLTQLYTNLFDKEHE